VRLIAVGQPNCVGEETLHDVREEMTILRSFSKQIPAVFLENGDATIAAVLHELESCTCAHFACHARQNNNHQMNTALEMHDGPLSLYKISKVSLQYADFAMLLACASARGTIHLPNEAIHIASGLQFAGFRRVLWVPA
jgi:CHAT domain-containing protein